MLPLIVIFLTFLGVSFLRLPSNAHAANLPILIDPSNNSTTTDTSPKLTWQWDGVCPSSGSCFRPELDDSADFSSIDKYIYTNNTSYTPQNLAIKKWFWRVKAKDSLGNWNISDVSSFTISQDTGNITSTTSNQAANSQAPTQSSQSFIVLPIPSSLNLVNTLSASVQIVGLDQNSNYYLKGAFSKSATSNYFGKTLVSNSWIKNSQTYWSQLPINTDSSGNWSGSIQVMVDTQDSGFIGSGTYIFKVARYSSSGSGPSWSNEATLNLIGEASSTTTSSSKTTPSPTGSPTKQTSSNTTNSLAQTAKSSANKSSLASISGVSTKAANQISASPSALVSSDGSSHINWFLLAGGGISLIGGVGSLVYLLRRG